LTPGRSSSTSDIAADTQRSNWIN